MKESEYGRGKAEGLKQENCNEKKKANEKIKEKEQTRLMGSRREARVNERDVSSDYLKFIERRKKVGVGSRLANQAPFSKEWIR